MLGELGVLGVGARYGVCGGGFGGVVRLSSERSHVERVRVRQLPHIHPTDPEHAHRVHGGDIATAVRVAVRCHDTRHTRRVDRERHAERHVVGGLHDFPRTTRKASVQPELVHAGVGHWVGIHVQHAAVRRVAVGERPHPRFGQHPPKLKERVWLGIVGRVVGNGHQRLTRVAHRVSAVHRDHPVRLRGDRCGQRQQRRIDRVRRVEAPRESVGLAHRTISKKRKRTCVWYVVDERLHTRRKAARHKRVHRAHVRHNHVHVFPSP